jgi:demethylmenaquinone methyltransferase/2-methoxy-6-polyprenyl-1,4-benzoquinol methylase
MPPPEQATRMGPDNQALIARYARHAAGYDASAQRTMPLRLRTIGLLALKPGEVVLDVGAGTGLSYEPLRQAVGEGGRVLAFEQSPHMFERAVLRVQQASWRNVWQVCAAAEDVRLPEPPDAVLFNYVHDITRSPRAVRNLLSQARPGARIAMAGMKFFPWWTGPLNLLVWLKNRPYNANPGELWQPWDLVQPWCADFRRWPTQCGMGYIAAGRLRGDPATSADLAP